MYVELFLLRAIQDDAIAYRKCISSQCRIWKSWDHAFPDRLLSSNSWLCIGRVFGRRSRARAIVPPYPIAIISAAMRPSARRPFATNIRAQWRFEMPIRSIGCRISQDSRASDGGKNGAIRPSESPRKNKRDDDSRDYGVKHVNRVSQIPAAANWCPRHPRAATGEITHERADAHYIDAAQ
jgi:hypothetical protein